MKFKVFKAGDKVKVINDKQDFYSCIKLGVFEGKFVRYIPTGVWAEVIFDDGSKRTRIVYIKDLESAVTKGEQLLFSFMED